jgi:hypothetical protein
LAAYSQARIAAERSARAGIKAQAHSNEVLQDLARITTHHPVQGALL